MRPQEITVDLIDLEVILAALEQVDVELGFLSEQYPISCIPASDLDAARRLRRTVKDYFRS